MTELATRNALERAFERIEKLEQDMGKLLVDIAKLRGREHADTMRAIAAAHKAVRRKKK